MSVAFFLLVTSFSLSFCNICHASVVQELKKKGIVQNGSMAYYNPDDATWTFKLNLLPPGQLTEKNMSFRLELEEVNHSQEITAPSCAAQSSKKFNSRTRRISTLYFKQLNEVTKTSTTFDHVYSGNYTLEIQCCEDISCDSCPNSATKYDDLFPVETKLNRIDIDCMNISIRATEEEGGIDLDFSVNYFSNPPFLEFKEFDVIISQQSKPLIRQITNSTNVRFKINFTEIVEERGCNENDQNSISSPENKTILCSAFSSHFIFNVTVHPRDHRCNYPLQIYESSKHPCKRYVEKELQMYKRPKLLIELPIRPSLRYVWIPLLVVMISISMATAIYLKRDPLCSSNHQIPKRPDRVSTSPEVRNHSSSREMLLVYDVNDKAMEHKASALRNQMTACGVSTIYDFCDPQQEENIATLGPVHWFSTHINNSNVCIVVIQSSGLIQCFEELLRVDRVNDVVPVQDNDLLLFVLHHLLSITSTSSDNLYDRIFVTTYSDLECTVHSYLTPFRCYNMPEHFAQLLNQLQHAL